MLTDEQIERYSRQIILPQVGGKGQEKLLHARVLVNGAGLLQEMALLYLAAAGIGTLGIVHKTESSLFSGFGPEPLDAFSTALKQLNPACTIIQHPADAGKNVQTLLHEVRTYDLILSEPDTQLHHVCYEVRKPFLCSQSTGAQCWFLLCRGYELNHPCLHCVPLPSGEEQMPALFTDISALFLGAQLTTEVVKTLLGLDQSSKAQLFRCEFPALRFDIQRVQKNPDCSYCGR